mgnify:CR=1 FL=1
MQQKNLKKSVVLFYGSYFVYFLGNRRIQNLLSLSAKTESTYN